jgi:hypothetical protein
MLGEQIYEAKGRLLDQGCLMYSSTDSRFYHFWNTLFLLYLLQLHLIISKKRIDIPVIIVIVKNEGKKQQVGFSI